MCTVVLLRRPGHDWPLLLAANRDEMVDRPWQAPGRHWPDRPDVVAGQDVLAGGSWLGLNDDGVVAAVLNRVGSLGPAEDKRSRGELVLEALDHADAAAAASALGHLDTAAYRPFNLVIADNRDGFWLRSLGTGAISRHRLAAGLHMVTAHDRNDRSSPRIGAHLDRWLSAPTPDPADRDWFAWEALLADRTSANLDDPHSAMFLDPGGGYGTVSSALIALPAAEEASDRPIWRFAPGLPDPAGYVEITA